MPTKLTSDYTVYGMYIGIFFKPVAGLAQSLEALVCRAGDHGYLFSGSD